MIIDGDLRIAFQCGRCLASLYSTLYQLMSPIPGVCSSWNWGNSFLCSLLFPRSLWHNYLLILLSFRRGWLQLGPSGQYPVATQTRPILAYPWEVLFVFFAKVATRVFVGTCDRELIVLESSSTNLPRIRISGVVPSRKSGSYLSWLIQTLLYQAESGVFRDFEQWHPTVRVWPVFPVDLGVQVCL